MESSTGANSKRETRRGLGLAVSLPLEVITDAALAVQENGYQSFWLNNPPGPNALEALGAVARVATSIQLGVGVIPLSARTPEEIVEDVRKNEVPLDRLYLGIGSGGGAGGVERVAQGLQALRSESGGLGRDATLVVAALGPRMCRLAGSEADSVLFNWLTPQYAKRSIAWVREGAEKAGRPVPRLMTYMRAAMGDEAIRRLEREAATYEGIPAYAAHFERMGTAAMGTAVTGSTPAEVQQGLAAWDGVVDEVVVRAIAAQDTIEDVRRIVEATRPS